VTPRDLAGAVFLLVEDDPGAARLVRAVLEHEEATVHIAGNATDALLRLHAGLEPAAILLDLGLPLLNGLDLARVLRALPATRSVPIIAVTAADLPLRHHTAIEAGCDGLIPKPIDVATFAASIAAIVRSRADTR
jgi:CheY-like chemotaxis protein